MNKFQFTDETYEAALKMFAVAQSDPAEKVRLQAFGFGWLFDVSAYTHIPPWKLPEVPRR